VFLQRNLKSGFWEFFQCPAQTMRQAGLCQRLQEKMLEQVSKLLPEHLSDGDSVRDY
jgi:hypothetical protein